MLARQEPAVVTNAFGTGPEGAFAVWAALADLRRATRDRVHARLVRVQIGKSAVAGCLVVLDELVTSGGDVLVDVAGVLAVIVVQLGQGLVGFEDNLIDMLGPNLHVLQGHQGADDLLEVGLRPSAD